MLLPVFRYYYELLVVLLLSMYYSPLHVSRPQKIVMQNITCVSVSACVCLYVSVFKCVCLCVSVSLSVCVCE